MAVRISLAVLALVVLAWTGVLLRDLYVGRDAAARSFQTGGPSAGQRERDRERLAEADLLDPSPRWELAHASSLLLSGDVEAAAREAAATARDEPENTVAWLLLREATKESDPARSAVANARLRELNPQGSR